MPAEHRKPRIIFKYNHAIFNSKRESKFYDLSNVNPNTQKFIAINNFPFPIFFLLLATLTYSFLPFEIFYYILETIKTFLKSATL